MNGHSSVLQHWSRPGIIVMVISILLLWTALAYRSHWHAQQELMALPRQERASLYKRTLATVQATCLHPNGSAISDFCRSQATLLPEFPECDDACQHTCQQLRPRPTK